MVKTEIQLNKSMDRVKELIKDLNDLMTMYEGNRMIRQDRMKKKTDVLVKYRMVNDNFSLEDIDEYYADSINQRIIKYIEDDGDIVESKEEDEW